MERFPHVVVSGTASSLHYTSTSPGGDGRDYAHPARDRVPHAERLTAEVKEAQRLAAQRVQDSRTGVEIRGIALECVSSEGDQLEYDKIDDRTAHIELLSTRSEAGRTYATVFVPEAGIKSFLKKIERYKTETNERRADKGPKHKELVESIESIQLPVVRSFWTDADSHFPRTVDEHAWFEVWLRTSPAATQPTSVVGNFRTECKRVGIEVDARELLFPERVVMIAYGTLRQWASTLSILGDVAELRLAKVAPTDFVEMPPRDVAEFIEDGAKRIEGPVGTAPAVCLLDTGVQHLHPLLKDAIGPGDLQTVKATWGLADDGGHGTEMAGIALFGDGLAEHLVGTQKFDIRHRLESVKLFRKSDPHSRNNYGSITTEALALAEIGAPQRKRVACLAITADDRDMGHPSSWSAALDQHSSGALDDTRRLYVVSAGNVRDDPLLAPQYPDINRRERGIEDPGQSWNCLTVGAHTDRATITSAEFAMHTPVAPIGGLSPRSRTSMMWQDDEWPLKPEVVMEGGNYAATPNGVVLPCDDLRLLTTSSTSSGRLLDTIADTSAATAQASRLAARLMEAYPSLWPETIRGLIVHSAGWTERMLAEFPSPSRSQVQARLRCYGYGVPNEERALWTARNAVTLIAQEALTPFEKSDGSCKTKDCHVHALPWPLEVLEALGEEKITVRITLSYFIEPSPGRRGWTRKFRYASHGLRFAVSGPLESDASFLKRITKTSWTDGERTRTEHRPDTGEPQPWEIGKGTRARGSVHSDFWTAPAAEVARCGKIAVYPVTGWWRERPHLGRIGMATRYALVVSITSPEARTDLLTPIRALVGVPIRAR